MERSDRNGPTAQPIARALTIAGSDSGGCAGIQADLKTFAALGVHGMSAITVVTAQDTCRVHAAHELPAALVRLQIEVVIEDIGVDAFKTGMLSSAAIIETVADCLGRRPGRPLVVDPVMVSTSGDPLIRDEAVAVLKERLLPLALVVTPNLPEAAFLVGRPLQTAAAIQEAAQEIQSMGARNVVIKGGHRPEPDQATDLLWDGNRFTLYAGPRFDTPHTHGSGCTFAAALTAFLAQGLPLPEALTRVKEYVSGAIRHALPLGRGHGPLGHGYQWWRR